MLVHRGDVQGIMAAATDADDDDPPVWRVGPSQRLASLPDNGGTGSRTSIFPHPILNRILPFGREHTRALPFAGSRPRCTFAVASPSPPLYPLSSINFPARTSPTKRETLRLLFVFSSCSLSLSLAIPSCTRESWLYTSPEPPPPPHDIYTPLSVYLNLPAFVSLFVPS